MVENFIGDQTDGPLSEWQPSLRKWTSELRQSASNTREHRMSMSITEATPDDGVAVTSPVQEDNRALTDRSAGLRMNQPQLAQH